MGKFLTKKKVVFILIAVFLLLYVVSTLIYKVQPKIALISIDGVISDYYPIVQNLDIARKSSSIKAVVIKVNSPGGSVGASQEIYRAIEKLRQEKPVVVSMGNVAASGGYYVSIPANVIYANTGTITGSIGVIVQHLDATKLLSKVGIKISNIKSGKNKDILYPNRPLTPESKKLLEKTIKDIYEEFLQDIVKYRNIDINTLRKYADGRIMSGKEAKRLKLIDKIGNIQDAVEEAKDLVGLKGKKVILIELKPKPPLLEQLLGAKIENILTPTGIYYLMSFE
ncbi:MAG: signal peptide peptidase SppA [Aquificae bacterium]|nr:signal peptide peptidase SppA [Aquificota bacterium]